MCTVMAAVGLISAGISAAGTIYQANANANIANANAEQYEQQARARQLKANFDQEQADREFRRTAGKQRAAAAASGFSVMSFADIFDDSALESGLEQKAIQFTADNEIAGLKTQASAARARGKAEKTGGYLSAAGSLLSGGARAYQAGGTINVGSAYSGVK